METSTSDRKKKNCKLDIYIYLYQNDLKNMTFLSRADVSPPSIYRPTNHVAFLLRMVSLTFVIFFFFFLSHFISLYFYIKHRCTEHCSAKLWSALKTNDDLEIKKKCKNERGRLIVHRRALSIRRSLYFRINRSFVLCIYYRNVIFVLL